MCRSHKLQLSLAEPWLDLDPAQYLTASSESYTAPAQLLAVMSLLSYSYSPLAFLAHLLPFETETDRGMVDNYISSIAICY